MKFKSLLAALTLSLSFGAAQAGPQLAIPYQSSGTASALLESSDVWAEVYPIQASNVDAALGRAMLGQAPADQVAAVIIQSTLHFAVGKVNEQLPERTSAIERKGSPVDYDEKCGVHPELGDHLTATYGKAGNPYEAELDVRVVRYLPFSDESDDPLDLAQPGACNQETHSRMFLSGVLRLKHQGKIQQAIPVLLQSIVEPRT